MIGIGFAVAARSWWVGAALVVMFVAIYVPVIRDEEKFLRGKFPEFEEYAQRVPRMLPRIVAHAAPPIEPDPAPGVASGGFSFELYMKHREWNALLGAVLMVAALVVKMMITRR